MRPLVEQVILVTGATDGLGKAVAMQLARTGATLLLHGRDESRGSRCSRRSAHRRATPTCTGIARTFPRLRRYERWQNGWLANRNALPVLLNNVGSKLPGGGRRQESEDGYELRFAVNYLAPFLLTRLLLPMLRQSAPARIVNVASAAQAPIDFRDVMLKHHYHGGQAYAQSKLALVMFTFDLTEELTGSDVTVNCLHPATYMPTKMVLAARGSCVSTLEEGVQATLGLITAPELDQISGRYFNGLREARAESQAYDRQARQQLRQLSERLAGFTGP